MEGDNRYRGVADVGSRSSSMVDKLILWLKQHKRSMAAA